MSNYYFELPELLKKCIDFHGHFCPGLTYGYLVSKWFIDNISNARDIDEEIYAVSECDSCSVDALQVILGTTIGKGNLKIYNYGKSCFTLTSRRKSKAFKFTKRNDYTYSGDSISEYDKLMSDSGSGNLSDERTKQLKILKALDLAERDCDEIFVIQELDYQKIDFAKVDVSLTCEHCHALVMESMSIRCKGENLCLPCAKKYFEDRST